MVPGEEMCSCYDIVCDECPQNMIAGGDGICSCICMTDMCWDGSAPNDNCECPDEPTYCTMDICWDGSSRDPTDCSCPDEPIFCTEDLCWDGTSRDPTDCSCPE